jgi:transcriptional regulator GlxA family with amidase domain
MKKQMVLALKRPERTGQPYLRVGILLCPGFTLTALASFVDSLRLAADRSDESRQIYFQWSFLAAGPEPLRASCGLAMTDMAPLGDAAGHDCLVVCGGLVRELPAVLPDVLDVLRDAASRNVPVVGLCTGSFVLAQAGLLEGRRCALHFDTFGEFTRRFPRTRAVTNENYACDGNVITAPGSLAAIEIAALLIEYYSSERRARKVFDYMLLKPEEARLSLKAKPYQEALESASRLTAAAVQMMEFRIDSPCSIEELAKALSTSKGRLHRAFAADLQMSPATFWRNIRLLTARELLHGKRRTITEIAYETGFSDAAHFCSSFKKHFSLTPQEFRRLKLRSMDFGDARSWSVGMEGVD